MKMFSCHSIKLRLRLISMYQSFVVSICFMLSFKENTRRNHSFDNELLVNPYSMYKILGKSI